jgi:hypothetical protein
LGEWSNRRFPHLASGSTLFLSSLLVLMLRAFFVPEQLLLMAYPLNSRLLVLEELLGVFSFWEGERLGR